MADCDVLLSGLFQDKAFWKLFIGWIFLSKSGNTNQSRHTLHTAHTEERRNYDTRLDMSITASCSVLYAL